MDRGWIWSCHVSGRCGLSCVCRRMSDDVIARDEATKRQTVWRLEQSCLPCKEQHLSPALSRTLSGAPPSSLKLNPLQPFLHDQKVGDTPVTRSALKRLTDQVASASDVPADQIRRPEEVDRDDPNIRVVELPSPPERKLSFKEQVYGMSCSNGF